MQPVTALGELILELSYNCDLDCVMCGFGGKVVSPERFMSEATLDRVLDAVEPPPRAIRLNGRGESTLHPNFVGILRHVRARLPRAQINLFSHLSWSRAGVMEALLECGVQLFVSMDSPDPTRLASIRRRTKFEKVVANLARLERHEPRPFLIFTLQEANFDDVLPMARFAADRNLHLLVNSVRRDVGIEPFRDLVASRSGELRAAFREVADLYAGRRVSCHMPDRIQGIVIAEGHTRATYGGRARCPAVNSELCVLFDGTVTPCNMFNPYVYGNVLEASLREIREGERFRWFEEHHKEHAYCANCACLGGTT